ncbi:MAG: regulatory protein NosR [Acetobacteraceae bacterium]|nr:regulatory protein NosR [Acetobacteraceae bacterium]
MNEAPSRGSRLRIRLGTRAWRDALLALCCLLGALCLSPPAKAAAQIDEFLSQVQPAEVFPGADRIGQPQGNPPIAPAFTGDRLLGYVYLTTDVTNATGYSGKPIRILVGIDTKGVIRGLKIVEHHEPIVLIGIPERRIVAAVNKLVGTDMVPIASGAERPPQVDIVSGATVTVLVIGDSVVRSAVQLIRSGRIAAGSSGAVPSAMVPPVTKTIESGTGEIRDWESLLGDGSVRRLHLTIGEVNEAFARSGNAEAAANPEPGDRDETFIDLYVAPVTIPTVGRSLLGDQAYEQLRQRLTLGQQAIVVAGNGIYSFKGSGYVRGGIFDRIELLQDGRSTRFRDRNHTRLGDLAAAGAPQLSEIALFTMPPDFALDLTEPWSLQLLVQRSVGAREKAFLSFDLNYTTPEKYIRREQQAVTISTPAGTQQEAVAQAAPQEAPPSAGALEEPLWQRIWRGKPVEIGVTVLALLVLTGIFFFQDALVRRPRLYIWVRRAFLVWTLVWLGWYAGAQLSVVNVLTFSNSLVTGFSWEYFLTAPLIFILWCAVAAALLFWARGAFCGWLCPYGALQELTNIVARKLKVPQITVPWGLQERLWPIKYIIFLGLFGLSLYSVGMAETYAEVEPFKTAIILKFIRDWPFVLYAAGLIVANLFIERFFCRYLCPLGAALAIPARIRMFEWLKRWPECGSPCQRCARECPVQCIHPEGNINPNECIYCMHCQELYRDDYRCPHNIQVRLKRERREAWSSPAPGKGPAKPVITRNGKSVEAAPPPAPASGAGTST